MLAALRRFRWLAPLRALGFAARYAAASAARPLGRE
jgi:hypothetical protein